MDKQDADKIITEYVPKLFGFAMKKLSDIDRAGELAAEITLQVYQTLLKQDNIVNIDGYIYKIATNVFVHYVDGKNKYTAVDGMEYIPDEKDFTDEVINNETFGLLRREITYLSNLQRKIIVLYYFHDKKVREIAQMLSLPENTVKWHLTCSRKELKTGMEKIRTTGNLGTEPIVLGNLGHNGSVVEKDTSYFLAKSLTQNIAYAAYHAPRTINEIAEELGVNPIFVADEVAVLEEYGFMDKLPGEKYRTNIHITEPNEEGYQRSKELIAKFVPLLTREYFAPALESITEIPEWLTVPDADLNLVKWSMVSFLAQKLIPADFDNSKYAVKRKDGGNYVATASVMRETPWRDETDKKYIFCGDMWRDNITENKWWKSWQVNCHWTDRDLDWSDNQTADYDKLYHFLKGELSETEANIESYKRLMDKGYLIKESGSYHCNVILCDSEQKWRSFLPATNDKTLTLAKEYSDAQTKNNLLCQPEYMHKMIAYYGQISVVFLFTRVMEELLTMGVLKEPTDEQKKGLCTILFLGE